MSWWKRQKWVGGRGRNGSVEKAEMGRGRGRNAAVTTVTPQCPARCPRAQLQRCFSLPDSPQPLSRGSSCAQLLPKQPEPSSGNLGRGERPIRDRKSSLEWHSQLESTQTLLGHITTTCRTFQTSFLCTHRAGSQRSGSLFQAAEPQDSPSAWISYLSVDF